MTGVIQGARNTFIAIALPLCAALPGSAIAGSQYVVVAAEPAAEAYAPGRVLNVNDTIVIPEGTVVTLLGEDGSVNAIPGPAEITVTEEAVETNGGNGTADKRSTLSKLAGLLAGERKNADSLGVARSFGAQKPRGLDDPWTISVHADGEGCVRGTEIRLGRSSDSKDISVAMVGDRGSKEVEMTWREGEAELVVPDTVAVTEGEIFVRAGRNQSLIRLHTVPVEINLQNPVDVLGWMLESGCERQALAFTRQLARKAE